MRLILLSIFGFFMLKSHAQSLFDINLVHKIEIEFFDDNWDHILDSLASVGSETGSGTERILANVIINGTALDSCGVRYKGNSSMDTTSNKNPFNLDLNYVIAGQEYEGKDKIKLANCFTDPSMIREALTYELANRYMDCPRASFVELFINGEYRGIYTNTESVDNEFLNQFYGSSDNAFFKCDPTSFELFGDNSNLAYHADTMVYDTLYDMKSTYGLTELQALTYELEFEPSTINNYLDVDRALWFLALSNALVHNDGYTAFGHNYYVYKMDNGQWSIVLWDVNMSFGGLLWNGENILPLSAVQLQEQDPFLHQEAYDFRPLIAQLLSNPKYRRMYIAHYKTFMEENIENEYYLERGEYMQALISPYVEIEPYNPYTFSNFNDNLYTNVGVWFNLRIGLEALMSVRNEYINGLVDFNYTQPTITEVLAGPENPDPFTSTVVTASVEGASSVQCAYRYSKFGSFEFVDMFDDGLHDDGAAGDGTYGISLPVLSTDIHYYIYAENSNAGKFSPVRAAYEYYTIEVKRGLVINEISAINGTIQMDEAGDFDDWIELYNNTDETINLNGYHLSDDISELDQWTFPNVSIAPNAYLIIWADNDAAIGDELHANFKLSSAGEVLTLSNSSDQIIDQVVFSTQFENITYGRFENGIGDFDYLYPTFNAKNDELVKIEENEQKLVISAYPNPTTSTITVQFSASYSGYLQLYDLKGQLVWEDLVAESNQIQLDLSAFENGLYLLRNQDNYTIRIIKQ